MWGRNRRLLEEILAKLKRAVALLERLTFRMVYVFHIDTTGATLIIKPGQSTILTATPLDSTGNKTTLPSGDVPTWAVSAAAEVVATPSADGLTLNVTVNANAVPGDIVFTITDGQIPTAQGTITLTVPAPAPNPVASFSIAASTPV